MKSIFVTRNISSVACYSIERVHFSVITFSLLLKFLLNINKGNQVNNV